MLNRIEKVEAALGILLQSSREKNVREQMSSQFLKTLAEALDCDWATYWEVQGSVLRPKTVWNSANVDPLKLIQDTENRTLSLSEGTAGHVWRSRKPIWSQDLALDMCLPRSLDAEKAGLHGGIWFAVKTDRAVYGVVELLGKCLDAGTGELLLAMENLGVKLGCILETDMKL